MLEIDEIPNLEENLARLDNDEGWVVPEGILTVDEWFPDYETDVGKSIVGIFWKRVEPKKKPIDGEDMVMNIYLITPKHNVIGVREVQLVKNAMATVSPGDGVRITYHGRKPIHNSNKTFHDFHIEVQRNNPKDKYLEIAHTPGEFTTGDKLPQTDEDPEARATIDMLINDWHNRFNIHDEDVNPTAVQILALAMEDKDFAENTEAIEKLKIQLAKDVTAGKIEDGGE